MNHFIFNRKTTLSLVLLLFISIFALSPGAMAALITSGDELVFNEATQTGMRLLDGEVTNDLALNEYMNAYRWSRPVTSYLWQDGSGNIQRVENTDAGVLVETYSASGTLTDTKKITAELPVFGGYFHGGDGYHYLVFGEYNTNESDDKEVVRVVRYNSSWERMASCSIKAINTYGPFEAGSLRMAEADGKLFIHTCHKMYQSGDSTRHQANMTFAIEEDTMALLESNHRVWNFSSGYVSHSFNQFLRSDGTKVFRVDHGDAHPRAVSLYVTDVASRIVSGSGEEAFFTIQGNTGANDTGVAVGGMELSADSVLIAGNSVDQSDASTYDASGQRNIFVAIEKKDLSSKKVVWLTNYSASDSRFPRCPQLVKVSDDSFLVLWEETTSVVQWWMSPGELDCKVNAVLIDANGAKKTAVVQLDKARLSDCQPILLSNGKVAWYTSNGRTVVYHAVDPDHLDQWPKKIDVTGVKLDETTATIKKGSSLNLTATVEPANASNKKVTWKTDDSAIATVVDGVVTAVGNGTTTITVTTEEGGFMATCDVTVADKIAVTAVTPSKTTLNLQSGQKEKLTATVAPENATDKALTWKTANPAVATVAADGVVTAVGVGTTQLTVTAGGVAATVTVTVTAAPAPFRFDDVTDSKAYYYAPVYWAVDHKPQITNGMTPTLFKPDNKCTRAQVVTFLWRAKGCPEPKSSQNPFTDVEPSNYFYKAVLWAAESGITTGMTETSFGPGFNCTREQVVTFLWRVEGKPAATGKNVFTDVNADAYYYEAVLWAVNHTPQITNGTSATKFNPYATCTRGQIVTFLYRDMIK